MLEELSRLPDEACEALLHDWHGIWSRPGQAEPEGNWRSWLIMSGRGWGKTRVGAEWVRRQLLEMPGCRVAIVARTYSDARDVCVEGESGLLACFSAIERQGLSWNRSMGEGQLGNGSMWHIFTAEKPDSLRGPQFHVLWADELAAWAKQRAAWEQTPYIVRLPWHAAPERAGRVIVTTTPRPVKELRDLMADESTVITRGSSFDNWQNLNGLTRSKLERLRGTRMGRQELEGELLDDTPGALWTRALIDSRRAPKADAYARVVVGVDPAASSHEDSDETGIVVAGRTKAIAGRSKRHVLEDVSLRGRPEEWARRAVEAYRRWEADAIVVEVNNGGEMCRAVIRAVDHKARVVEVRASRGKQVRAEPVATAYEVGDVEHVGRLERLEDQLCTWTPDSDESPDRLDAMVWALTALESSASDIPKSLPEAPPATGMRALSL